MPDQSVVTGVLYLAAVAFFALWRSEIDMQAMRLERARRLDLIRMVMEETDRQRSVLGDLELTEFDAIREIV